MFSLMTEHKVIKRSLWGFCFFIYLGSEGQGEKEAKSVCVCVCICANNLMKLQLITAALNGLGTIGGRQEEEGQVPFRLHLSPLSLHP